MMNNELTWRDIKELINIKLANSLSEKFNELLVENFEKALGELGYVGLDIYDIYRFMADNNITIDRIIEYIDRRYCYYIYKDNKIVIEFSISSVDYSVEYKKLDV